MSSSKPHAERSETHTDGPRSLLDFEEGSRGSKRHYDGAGADEQKVEQPSDEISEDDLSPETLLDDGGVAMPSERMAKSSADTVLTTVSNIGGGNGLDEAELADLEPVGTTVSKQQKKIIQQHARDPKAFEPAEQEEMRARELAKSKQKSS